MRRPLVLLRANAAHTHTRITHKHTDAFANEFLRGSPVEADRDKAEEAEKAEKEKVKERT